MGDVEIVNDSSKQNVEIANVIDDLSKDKTKDEKDQMDKEVDNSSKDGAEFENSVSTKDEINITEIVDEKADTLELINKVDATIVTNDDLTEVTNVNVSKENTDILEVNNTSSKSEQIIPEAENKSKNLDIKEVGACLTKNVNKIKSKDESDSSDIHDDSSKSKEVVEGTNTLDVIEVNNDSNNSENISLPDKKDHLVSDIVEVNNEINIAAVQSNAVEDRTDIIKNDPMEVKDLIDNIKDIKNDSSKNKIDVAELIGDDSPPDKIDADSNVSSNKGDIIEDSGDSLKDEINIGPIENNSVKENLDKLETKILGIAVAAECKDTIEIVEDNVMQVNDHSSTNKTDVVDPNEDDIKNTEENLKENVTETESKNKTHFVQLNDDKMDVDEVNEEKTDIIEIGDDSPNDEITIKNNAVQDKKENLDNVTVHKQSTVDINDEIESMEIHVDSSENSPDVAPLDHNKKDAIEEDNDSCKNKSDVLAVCKDKVDAVNSSAKSKIDFVVLNDDSTDKMDVVEVNNGPQKKSNKIKKVTADTIDIVDIGDDSPKEHTEVEQKGKKSHCLNAACKSAVNLIPADSSVFTYYDLKKSNINNRVCVRCHAAAENHFSDMMEKFSNDECMLDVQFPAKKEIVCIDSDEEIDLSSDSGDEGAPYDKDTMDLINNELNNLLAFHLPLSRVDGQAKKFISHVTKDAEAFEKELKDQQDLLQGTQLELDRMHKSFYAQFDREYRTVSPFDITSDEETPTEPEPVIVQDISDVSTPSHQDEYRQQQMQQHQTLLQRRLLAPNNPPSSARNSPSPQMIITRNTPSPQALTAQVIAARSSATISMVPAQPQRNVADDMIVEERRNTSSRPLNLPRLAPQGVSPYKPPIHKDSVLWGMKKNNMSSWGKCIVDEVITTLDENKKSTKRYKVKLLPEKKVKVVAGNALAYTKPNEYLYRVGMRVIAIFASKDYYSGTVAEIPKETNKWRYLIFFDDGYTSYSFHEDILMICEPSEKTQDDVPQVLRDFIREYLQKYPERAMVKLSVGEKMATQYKNKWVNAKVLEVDCSLARMCFGSMTECDWIFRGSDRLRPLYETKINAARRNMLENSRRSKAGAGTSDASGNNYMVPLSRPKVQTARKSLSGKNRPQVYFETTADKKVGWTPVRVPGKCVYKRVEGVDIVQCKKFVPHTCNKSCVSWIRWNFDSLIKKVNLLAIPLYTGFRRKMMTFQNNKKCIMYTAPCGRTLRSSEQLVLYLFNTRSKWTIDMFEFDHFVDCFREFVLENANITIKDMSNGRENVPISCVNYIDTDVPKTVDYMTERKPKEGVTINTNTDFLVCCDCTDDCRNRDECACWQLTIMGSRDLWSVSEPKDFVGYQNRRLPEHVVSGIFECNDRCKCKQSCHNRVVQFPMLQKLQLFKTEMKGWGLRCLNDIPQGTFICIYAGHLLTDNDANEEGKNYGDEYLAELDFIETVERYKEAYESDVPEEDMIDEDEAENDNSDDEESPASNEDSQDKDLRAILNSDDDTESTSGTNVDSDDIRSRLRKRKQRLENKKEGKRKTSSLLMTLKANQKKKSKRMRSLREYFGEDENVYIMDARTSGNIGRYLNHSCTPNVFVQNVFVDTHDPRFPWVSFFALKFIEAGSELTWDYAYDIGSVPDKVVYCYCGTVDCRQRLL